MDATEYKGYTYKIDQDEDTEDPLQWTTPAERGAWFVLKNRNYTLPYEIDADTADFNSWTELAESVTAKGGELAGKVYKFVRWYEHSGIAVSLRDDESGRDWDAGIAGVIFGDTTEMIEGAFSDWQHYVEGSIYSVLIEDADGEIVDSLGGIFGYTEAETEAKSMIDEALAQPRAGHKPKTASQLHR